MANRISARSLKRRSRKFVPSAAGSSQGAILEARISAAALFYRPVDPALITAEVDAGGGDDDLDAELNAAQAALTWQVTVNEPWEGPITWKQTSKAVNTLVDVPNPGPPSPVGSGTISLAVNIQSSQSELGNNFVGFGPPQNGMQSTIGGDRTYALARSDSSTGANVTIQESFTFSYTGPSTATGFLAVSDVGSFMTFTSPSFGVNWIPNEMPQYAVATGSTPTSPPIDTQNFFSITVNTPKTLPVQPSSLPWRIDYGARIATTIVGGNGSANNEVLTMSYSAKFLT